jgi:hypothetical protein
LRWSENEIEWEYWGTMEKSGEWLVNDGINTVERGWDQDSLRRMG